MRRSGRVLGTSLWVLGTGAGAWAQEPPAPSPVLAPPGASVDLGDHRYDSMAAAQQPLHSPPAATFQQGTDQQGMDQRGMDQRELELSGARGGLQRVDLWGYAAASYLHTESGGSFPRGALAIDQASLFVRAQADEDVFLFFEVQTDYLQRNSTSNIRIGEVYAHFRDVLTLWEGGKVGVKVGRIDLPFGEWYLQEDATDNALVGFPVVLPYGWDEGLLVHARWRGWGLLAAFTEGTLDRQSEDGLAKSVTLKVHGDASDTLYLSGSARWQGEGRTSALCLNATTLTPVGSGAASTLGSSPDPRVSNVQGEADVIWRPATGYLVQAALGAARVDDDDASFDRTLLWYVVEGQVPLRERVTGIVRWSEAGTFDRHEGYRLTARPYGNGTQSLGYDLARFSRLAAGLRWQPTPHVAVKGEIGFDSLRPIDASALGTDTRLFGALSVVVGF